MTIAAQLAAIHSRIAAAALRAGRDSATVRLIAVSKTQPASAISAAAAAGQRLFGENYVQELTAKLEAVAEPVEWHFIGSLQSNKVKYLAGRVAMIHSVDRLSLAEEIERQWSKLDRIAEILLEVNLGDESSKGGIRPEQLPQLAAAVARLPHLRLRGLMALPPLLDEAEAVRPYFRRLRLLAAELQASDPALDLRELSMGMSHDFEIAIEEGATLIRVGTAIFGARQPKM